MTKRPIRVIELFAGVGGFRLGLEKTPGYQVVWSNQWEPSTKKQHASLVYEARFGNEGHANEDIEQIPTETIPDHDLLVGGFPCQDYSVATTLHNSKGLIGKKGVLWWSIHRILQEKSSRPGYLFLENVDRLLKSPAKQRGRDFAIMLQSLSELGYAVEWRVINAAEYGMPQRRRRVFFLAYHESTPLYKQLQNSDKLDWMAQQGIIAKAFPVKPIQKMFSPSFEIEGNLVELSENFGKEAKKSAFRNTGVMINGVVHTQKTIPHYKGPYTLLGDIIINHEEVPEEFFLTEEKKKRWEYLKGSKKEMRTSKSGHKYHYSEGGMTFPDALDRPSRTIITGEGGSGPSRFKHVIETPKGLRRLTPIELERLNMFPDNHTQLDGISDTRRAFMMGNALVIGIIEKIGKTLYNAIQHEV